MPPRIPTRSTPARWNHSQDRFRICISQRPGHQGLHTSRTEDVERQRLSQTWVPTGGIAAVEGKEDSTSLLVRAGFLRQAHSGIFHLLPLGLRVQEKIQRLIERHMQKIGASKLSLSSISSEEIWRKSGRLQGDSSELFRFRDRKKAAYLLSPTHEEEITSMVAAIAKSYRDLPLRLFQITRKYRDEPRPRQGLLRTREFVMKDLYTFDCNAREALTTYNDVRDAYIRLFDSFRIPYIVANADSGNMGGNLSHEFHLPSSNGEDNVITCGSCGYAANEEVAKSRIQQSSKDLTETIPHRFGNQASTADTETSLEKTSGVGISQDPFAAEIGLWTTTTKDRKNLVNVLYPKQSKGDSGSNSSQIQHQGINIHRIRKLVPGIETSLEDPVALWRQSFQNQAASTEQEAGIHPDSNIINIFDYRLSSNLYTSTFSNHSDIPTSAKLQGYFSKQIPTTTISQDPDSGEPLDVLKIKNDDNCPQCSTGLLRVHKAVELGHNFFLGTRYSEPLGATISNMESDATEDQLPESTQAKETRQALQMGCHGIGVSRMIGAFADVLADEKGLNWPRVMAPYEAIILPNKGFEEAALEVYDTLAQVTAPSMGFQSVDVILDDRTKSLAWKLQDADLIGVPLIIIVGRAWKANRKCEIQCRRLKIKGMEVSLDQLQESVDSMLDRL